MHLKQLLSTLTFLIISLHTYAQGEWAIEIKEAQGSAPLITADTVGNIYLACNIYDTTKRWHETKIQTVKINSKGAITWSHISELPSYVTDISYLPLDGTLQIAGRFVDDYIYGDAQADKYQSYSSLARGKGCCITNGIKHTGFMAYANTDDKFFSLTTIDNIYYIKNFIIRDFVYNSYRLLGNDTTYVNILNYQIDHMPRTTVGIGIPYTFVIDKKYKDYDLVGNSLESLFIRGIPSYNEIFDNNSTIDDYRTIRQYDSTGYIFRFVVDGIKNYHIEPVKVFDSIEHVIQKRRKGLYEQPLGIVFNDKNELIIPYTIDSLTHEYSINDIHIVKANDNGKALLDRTIVKHAIIYNGFKILFNRNDYYLTFSAKDYCYIGKKKYSFEGEYRSYILKMDNDLKIKSIIYLSSPNTLRISSTIFSDGYIYCTGEFSGVLKHDLHTLKPSAKKSTFLIKTKL